MAIWPGEADLAGAMAADGYCGIETKLALLATANAKADNGVGMLSSHSEYKARTENIRLSLTPH